MSQADFVDARSADRNHDTEMSLRRKLTAAISGVLCVTAFVLMVWAASLPLMGVPAWWGDGLQASEPKIWSRRLGALQVALTLGSSSWSWQSWAWRSVDI
jgi:protein-S-isoprenylcysteine O-methyltransferase Ste14